MHSHVFRISEIGFVPEQLWRLFPSLPCFLLWDAIRKSEQNYKHKQSPVLGTSLAQRSVLVESMFPVPTLNQNQPTRALEGNVVVVPRHGDAPSSSWGASLPAGFSAPGLCSPTH